MDAYFNSLLPGANAGLNQQADSPSPTTPNNAGVGDRPESPSSPDLNLNIDPALSGLGGARPRSVFDDDESQDANGDGRGAEESGFEEDSSVQSANTSDSAPRRRLREDDDDSDALDHPAKRSAWDVERARAFSDSTARRYQLSSEDREALSQFSKIENIAEMLIDIKASILLQNALLTRGFMNLYVKSDEFLLTLNLHIAAALLSPTLKAYVSSTAEDFIKHIQVHYQLFHLRAEVVDDPVIMNIISGIARQKLTDFRSGMRKSIEASVAKKEDIYELAKSLLKRGVKLNHGHWGRFAFLRQMSVTYDPSKKDHKSFWHYVDKSLQNMRAIATKPGVSRQDGLFQINELFEKMLRADIAMFPQKTTNKPVVEERDIPNWQTQMEKSMNPFKDVGA